MPMVYIRTLKRAAELIGDEEALARKLRVAPATSRCGYAALYPRPAMCSLKPPTSSASTRFNNKSISSRRRNAVM